MRNTLPFAVVVILAVFSVACRGSESKKTTFSSEAERLAAREEHYKEIAKVMSGISLSIYKVRRDRGKIAKNAEYQIDLSMEDSRGRPMPMTFSSNHVDIEKIKTLREGQTVWFRYEESDGDPTINSGGDHGAGKYLRVQQIE